VAFNRDKAAMMLAQGYKQEEVAGELGVSPSYISTLVNSVPSFKEKVTAYKEKILDNKAGNLSTYAQIDEKYNSIEMELLDAIKDNLGAFNDPRDAMRLLSIVNNAKRRSEGENSVTTPGDEQLVEITLPDSFMQHVGVTIEAEVSDNNQILSVNGRSLETIEPSVLERYDEKQNAQRKELIRLEKLNPKMTIKNTTIPQLSIDDFD
jgi:transcriptional regulator with XRE-family HTH domain